MAYEIDPSLLRLRATVKRYAVATGDYTNTVYTNLPCRIVIARNQSFSSQERTPSELESTIFICNYYFESVKIDLRIEDRIIIGSDKYRLLTIHDSESAAHHFEGTVERLKTMASEA